LPSNFVCLLIEFFACGVFLLLINTTFYKNSSILVWRMKVMMSNIDKLNMARSCSQLLPRMLEVVVVDGDFIEQNHFSYIYLSYVFYLSKI